MPLEKKKTNGKKSDGVRQKEEIQGRGAAQTETYFDINLLELACIDLALSGENFIPPDSVHIGNSERILRIQRENLTALCKKLNQNPDTTALRIELIKILSGEKKTGVRFFAPMKGESLMGEANRKERV